MDKDITTYGDNYFEEVIDKMILDGIPGMNQAFVDIISNLPRDEKRMTILNLLDKDQNLFNQIKALTDKKINKMEHIKDIVVMLRKYVKDADVQKKKFGEVMTPIELVKEMLSKLPDGVWSNPNLKWLDPANGTGPFPSIVIYKLMKGLESWEPDEEKRYKHIVENMIYVVEIQPKNMFLYMCAFDPFDTYKLNIYTGSFLDDGFNIHMKEVWGLDKFDIIIGNPPYQKKNDGDRKASPLWDKFVYKSYELLDDNGFIAMVHPNGWRNIDGDFKYIQNILKSKLIYLNMNSVQDGENIFGASTSFDYYTLSKNKEHDSETEINDYDGKIEFVNISKYEIIPNCDIPFIYSLIADENEDKIKVLHSYSLYETRKYYMSRKKTETHIYPCVYSLLKNGTLNFFYSNKKLGFFEPKVIFGNGANPTYYVDRSGEFGMTQFTFGVVGDIDSIEKAISEKRHIIDKITSATKFISTNGNPILYPKILSIFRSDFFEKIRNFK